MKLVPFVKMHGLGNDFVIIDARLGDSSGYAEFASRICDRKMGVGCDQLLIIEKSSQAHAFMNIYNGDGSTALMCGNGIRCVAVFLKGKDQLIDDELLIETPSGNRQVKIISENEAEARMGEPLFEPGSIPIESKSQALAAKRSFGKFDCEISCVSVGNPHCVLLGDDELLNRVSVWGPVIERDGFFPMGTNVEFVKVKDRKNIVMRVWERGAGETLACGSGAVASHAVCRKLGLVDDRAGVEMRGGRLSVFWDGRGESAMRGAVKKVYEGCLDLDAL